MFWARARREYAGLTAQDEDIRRYLEIAHEVRRNSYDGLAGWIQDLGHRWVARHTRAGRVLEIGAGSGRHARFYRGTAASFFMTEYADLGFDSAEWRGPMRQRAVRCDARRLPFSAGSFDSVISLYNLEHIGDLAAVLGEVHRVLSNGGQFLVAVPCEGGLAWNVGRELTTRRSFQKRYQINYDKIIAYEHVRDLAEVQSELAASRLFDVQRRVFLPCGITSRNVNLIACFELVRCPFPGDRC